MIIKEQKPIIIRNQCGALFDEEDLKQAILWYTQRPVSRVKTVYMHGNYPAVSIYFEKLHIHRLLMMYYMQRDLDRNEYVHHKNGNKLDARKDNLSIMNASLHQSMHNKGKVISEYQKQKIIESNRKRKGMRMKRRIHIPVDELTQLVEGGKSIRELAEYYNCSQSTIRTRIYKNSDLVEGKDDNK